MNMVETFLEFINNSFQNGKTRRELRLSDEEVLFIENMFPNAKIKRMSSDLENTQMRNWYLVDLDMNLVLQRIES